VPSMSRGEHLAEEYRSLWAVASSSPSWVLFTAPKVG
jgi:hypothetical protein